jgi:hypothetical protein
MENKQKCEWVQKEYTDNPWITSCGKKCFFLANTTPRLQDLYYCPYCGRIIEEMKTP